MAIPVVLSKAYTVAANTTTMDTIYTVSPARKLRLKKITLNFPATTANNLRVEFFRNEIKIIPTVSDMVIVGDNTKIVIESVFELVSGESLRVKLSNVSTTQANSCVIYVEGEEL